MAQEVAAARGTGTVVLAFLIGDDGTVVDALVRKSSGAPLLDEAALQGIRHCKFKPATVDGVAVGGWQQMHHVWTLETSEIARRAMQDAPEALVDKDVGEAAAWLAKAGHIGVSGRDDESVRFSD